ncbi:unnamed protein product [Schistosoma turkestanicum]|nr:unnamed protein product [Schistosoma turkestanicum]
MTYTGYSKANKNDCIFCTSKILVIIIKIFERLCILGANLDARNDSGLTVLHMKVHDNNFEDVLALLIRGADPNLCDINGATPLHYAMTYNASIHTIRALLAFEADPYALDNNQHSCRHLLCSNSESYVPTPDRNQMSKFQTMSNNDLSNGMRLRSYNSHSENYTINNDNMKQQKSRKKLSKLQRRLKSKYFVLN